MNLTKTQLEVSWWLLNGFFIWTNEGNNFKAWIGLDDGSKIISVRVKTVEALLKKKYIKFVDGDYPQGLYKYERTYKKS